MCTDYRTNAKSPEGAPAKSRLLDSWWRSYGVLVGCAVVLVATAAITVAVRPRAASATACADEAFWLLKAEEVRCHPGQLLDIDYAKGWATCRCDAMAPLRDAWRKEAGEHMAEIDEKIVAHGHQFEVTVMQFEAVFAAEKKQDARLDEIVAGLNALGYQKAMAAKDRDDAKRGSK